jgi:hypothetical protein
MPDRARVARHVGDILSDNSEVTSSEGIDARSDYRI